MNKICNLFFLFLTLSFTNCSNEDTENINIQDYETTSIKNDSPISKDSLMSQVKKSILNYEGTGVNFYIETDKSFLTRSTLNGLSETQLILKTELTNNEIIETKLLYKFEDNGNIVITHFAEDIVFATLYLNSKGQIFEIDLSDVGQNTRSIKTWYNCVNTEYQKIKQKNRG